MKEHPIQLVDLKRQYLSIKKEIDAAIREVLDSSSFILGEYLERFEKEFAKFCGTKYAIGVSSGTAALHLTLLACGIGKGDEVVTTPFTFIATTEAISRVGAKIVFCDIDRRTFNIDISHVETKITPRTKAIIPVHLYGQPCDMDGIMRIAKKHNLIVIEDACQAHGAFYKDKRVGSFGDVGCFSFYPGKNLGCYGDGGMVVTNRRDVAEKAELLRNHGCKVKYEHLVEGFNERLDALQANILHVKLKYLDRWNKRRQEIAKLYDLLLSGLPIEIPYKSSGMNHVYHLYVIKTPQRDKLHDYLRSKGILCQIHYPVPLHLQPAYKNLGYKKDDFPNANTCASGILSLPMFPELEKEEIGRIADIIRAFFRFFLTYKK